MNDNATLLVIADAAVRDGVSSAIADAGFDYELAPRSARTAETLLGYAPALIICDAAGLASLPPEERAVLRQVGVEMMLVFDSSDGRKLPLELGIDITDFIPLPADPIQLKQRVSRAKEIFKLRSTVTATPNPSEARAVSERIRAVASGDTDRLSRVSGSMPAVKPGRQADLERLKSNLITIISHEFKTPLHLAAGYIGLLDDRSLGELNESQAKAVDTVKRQLGRLSEKLADIERIAQLEMGLAIELREPVDVAQLLKNEARGFEDGARKKHLSVEVKCDPHLPPVPGSQDFLSDVFRRLIDNAIHYTETGGRVSISARLERGGGGKPVVVASVVDTGKGIPPAMLPHIFDRFGEFRDIEHHSSRRSGLGLGLAIVRHLVEVHDGTISVTSEVGKGSTFTVTLPVG